MCHLHTAPHALSSLRSSLPQLSHYFSYFSCFWWRVREAVCLSSFAIRCCSRASKMRCFRKQHVAYRTFSLEQQDRNHWIKLYLPLHDVGLLWGANTLIIRKYNSYFSLFADSRHLIFTRRKMYSQEWEKQLTTIRTISIDFESSEYCGH